MALECICIPLVDPRLAASPPRMMQNNQQMCCADRKPKKELDLCEIVKRTRENEQTKHNEYECHLKGERRQNLINKIRMYLDGYDDRPVMKSAGKGDAHTAKGQTGFGPMIKYPGYVDYNHPYFSDPYNKLPTLATTVGQRGGENPCPPISVRNYDDTHGQGGVRGGLDELGCAGAGRGGREAGPGCHCAKRRDEFPKCPAASAHQPQPRGRMDGQQWDRQEVFQQPGMPTSSPAMVCLCRTLP